MQKRLISKLLVVFLVIPDCYVHAAVAVSHLLNLIILSLWLFTEEGKSRPYDLGRRAAVRHLGGCTDVLGGKLPIWMAPLIGWFLFVSAWAKRGPLLRAIHADRNVAECLNTLYSDRGIWAKRS